MDPSLRRALEDRALEGVLAGPDATPVATAAALDRATESAVAILVEGVSDLMAVEAVAVRRGVDLSGHGVVVVPIGGASAIGTFLKLLGPGGHGLRLTGLCDLAEELVFANAVCAAGLADVPDRAALEKAGFFVCVEDLEDELVRAAGRDRVESLLDSQGDLGSFRTLQRQPAWRDRGFTHQVRRYLGAGARRKLRYARLLVSSLEADQIPRPLNRVLDAAVVPA